METTEAMEIGRRRFLKYLAIAGAIATMGISGCVSEPEPTPSPSMPTRTAPALPATATPAPTPTINIDIKRLPAYDDYYTTLVKTTLTMGDFNVTSAYVAGGWGVGAEDRVLILGYVSNANTKEELAGEIGSITHTFVDAVRDGWGIDAIIVAVGDINDNIIGTWHCEGFWVKDYLDGKTKRETLYTQIMNTHKFTKGCHMSLSSLEDKDCHPY